MQMLKLRNFLVNNRIHLIFMAILFAVNVVIYVHTLNSSFHFDDEGTVTKNSLILSLKNIFLYYNERPVLTFTFALNYFFGRLNTFGYHLVNLLLHFLNAVLIYLIVLLSIKLFLDHAESKDKKSNRIAFFTALIFTVHPMWVESVVYISSRSVLLLSFFYLLGFLSFLLSFRFLKKSIWFYSLTIISSLLAIGSKETGATFPFVIFFFDYIVVSKWRFLELKKRAIFYLFLFLTLGASIYLIWQGYLHNVYGKTAAAGFGTSFVSPFRYLLTQFSVVLYYLLLIAFPHQLNLDYDWRFAKSLFEFPTFFSFLILLMIALFALKIRKRTPFHFFWIIWYFFILSPDSSINPLKDAIFLHRAYLPSIGPLFLAILGLDRLFSLMQIKFGKFKKSKLNFSFVETTFIALVTFIFGFLTIRYGNIWLDELSLWKYVVKLSPNKARPHLNLGMAYKNAEFYRTEEKLQTLVPLLPEKPKISKEKILSYRPFLVESMKEFETSFRIDPNYVKGRLNLGGTYYELGDIETALKLTKEALQINPHLPETHLNISILYLAKQDFEKAIQHLKTAVALRSDFLEAYYNLATAYVNVGNINEAIKAYRKVIQLNPRQSFAYSDLGALYSKKNMLEEAIKNLNMAIRLNPKDVLAHYNLAVTYEKIQQYQLAIQHYKEALKINPHLTACRNALIGAYLQEGRLEDILALHEELAKINPKDTKAATNLVLTKMRIDEIKERLTPLQEAIMNNPKNKEKRMELGKLWLEINSFRQAKKEFESLIKEDPKLYDAHIYLGLIYGKEKDYPAAVKKFEEAISINPSDPRGYYNLAVSLEALGIKNRAKEEYQKTIRLKPNHSAALLNLSSILVSEGSWDEALKLLKELLRYVPQSAEAHLNLGVIYIQKRDFKQAEEALKKSLNLKPDYALAHFNLGKLYLQMQKKDLALKELAALEKMNSNLVHPLKELIEESK